MWYCKCPCFHTSVTDIIIVTYLHKETDRCTYACTRIPMCMHTLGSTPHKNVFPLYLRLFFSFFREWTILDSDPDNSKLPACCCSQNLITRIPMATSQEYLLTKVLNIHSRQNICMNFRQLWKSYLIHKSTSYTVYVLSSFDCMNILPYLSILRLFRKGKTR